MKVLISMISILIGLSACERTFELDFPKEDDEYILYAELPENEPIKAFLSKSASINEKLDFTLDYTKFEVVLYEFNEVIDTLEWKDKGYYESNQPSFSVGSEYSLKVFNIDKTVIIETHSVSPIVYDENVEIINTNELTSGFNVDLETQKFEVAIEVKPETDYYSFVAHGTLNNKKSRVGFFTIGSDSEVKSDCGFSLPNSLFFSSKCGSVGKQKQEFGVELAIFDVITRNMVTPNAVTISVRQIDKEWFDYYMTISDPHLFENIFSQPQVFNSRFKKGRGVWAAANLYEKTFDLE